MDEIHAHAASTALAKAERIRTTGERALLEAKLDLQRRMYLTKSSLCSTGSRVVTALTNRGEATVTQLVAVVNAARQNISAVLHGAYPPCQLPKQALPVHFDFEFRVSSPPRFAREMYGRDGEHGCRNPTTDLAPPRAFPPRSQPGDVRHEQAIRPEGLEARPR